MAKNDFQYGGWNSYTLQCGTKPGEINVVIVRHDHDIDFAR